MKRTAKYGLTYYEKGDFTSSIQEMQRWETLDSQLFALFQIIGNGVISGWNLIASSGLNVVITSGSGHVYFVAVKSTQASTIGLTPGTAADLANNVPATTTRNYIYASLAPDSYWTQRVLFTSSIYLNSNNNVLLLGYVDCNDAEIISINTDAKQNLGFTQLVNSAIKNHRHIGGTTNPSQINLATDVQGQINQENLPSLNADVIQAGVLDPSVVPVLDHNTKLTDIGTLTHAQLDEFVNLLSIPNQSTMGEVSAVNLLQLILAVKHVYPDIDESFVNEIAIIPGITPDNYIDSINTTAIVDTNTASHGGTHTITGKSSNGFTAYTKIWQSEKDFKAAESSDIVVNGDSISLETKENILIIDPFDFSTANDGWNVTVQDLSSLTSNVNSDPTTYVIPPFSGKVLVGANEINYMLTITKSFNAQDWSSYNYLVFYVKTSSIEHGEMYFYIQDNVYGIQTSLTKILEANAPTIDINTGENGWQEITIDISSLQRQNINQIGFYFSTQNKWDTTKEFNFNLDNIYLTSGNIYKNTGYSRFIFGSDFLYKFWRVRWDDIIPIGPESDGVQVAVRTRCANSLSALQNAPWTVFNYVSGYEIPIPDGQLYSYIEIEFDLTSSYSFSRSAILKRIYLDFYATDVDFSFQYSSKADWDTGYQFNIDSNTYSNSISIANINEIGDYSYGTDGAAVQTDKYLVEKYKISGSMMPRSTYQVIHGIQPSFGTITGMVRGDNGNVWLSDIDNDRIVQVDKSGSLISGFMGSFLADPIDVYSGANSVSSANSSSISVLHSIYNFNSGYFYIICDTDLENIYSSSRKLNLNGIYAKVGGHRIYFNDSDVSLLGFDIDKYNLWKSLIESESPEAQNIKNFTLTSNVLKFNVVGANRTLLDNLTNQMMPSIVIASPTEQQRTIGAITINLLTYNFELGSMAGEQAIRVTIDEVPQIIYTKTLSLSGLSTGKHTIKAELLQSNGDPFANIEAVANSSFVVNPGVYIYPYISIVSPVPNQIYSNSPITITFSVENFAVIHSGQHLKYSIDGGVATDYYSINPITLTDLSAGKHSFTIYAVDENGNSLPYDYSSVTVEFIVGLNSNAIVKLYIQNNSLYSSSEAACNVYSGYVDVGNMYLRNIYSPIDVQVNNFNDPATILVAKVRSPSWTEYLSGQEYFTEYLSRLGGTTSANIASVTTLSNSFISSIPTANLLFSNGYIDGYSVVELDQEGNTIFSNNDANFSGSKETAKKILGSCEMTELKELMIGDSYNKRAIISVTEPKSRTSEIQWEYNSDRYVSDFHLVPQNDIIINIYDGYIDVPNLTIRSGISVVWVNNSSIPISIWSGQTTYDIFYGNPDFNLYGDDFSSNVIQVGDSFTFKFNSQSTYYWFVYPSILTGVIISTSQRITERDQYIILENDGLESAFSSRVIRTDSYGNINFSFGQGYLVNPRDARPLYNGNIIIST